MAVLSFCMGKIIKIPLRLNKKNGQLQAHLSKVQLPKKALSDIFEGGARDLKKLLVEYKGLE